MPIDYKLSKLVIDSFRGIGHLELDFRKGFPAVLIGSNNAGKSTILNAIALALGGGGSHQWTFSDADFFCDENGKRAKEFFVQVHFHSDTKNGYPAVKGVGKPTLIQGVQVKGNIRKDGRIVTSRTLIDAHGKAVTISTRTPLAEVEKKLWAEHDVGYRVMNAKLDDIYEHPHLRRKLRMVLGDLAAKGWTVVYTTHSSELVSFDEDQLITRMVRSRGSVVSRTVHTDKINADAKLQSKLDERGAHDFLFGTAAIFCEGKDDSFAVRLGFEKTGIDCDGRSISITQCGSVTAIPAFAKISKDLGIRWCSLTDQDLQQDGTIKVVTEKARNRIQQHLGDEDRQVHWPVDLENCLGVTSGKATPAVSLAKISDAAWEINYPKFKAVLKDLAEWIDPTLNI
jgi:predicted ATP-dependent endonuclease of OLD family